MFSITPPIWGEISFGKVQKAFEWFVRLSLSKRSSSISPIFSEKCAVHVKKDGKYFTC